ncbi:MAG: TetR/AcrR family transcriptional regulator, partial [Myxococcota bacterium]
TLLVRDGVAGIPIKKVAAEAGVNHGLVHYHFGSKEGLVVAAYARYLEAQHERAARVDPHDRSAVHASFVEEVRRSSQLMVEFAALSAHMPRLRQAIDQGLRTIVTGFRARLGLASESDGDRMLAHFFGIAVHSRLRRDFDVEAAVEAFLDTYLPDQEGSTGTSR